jgi:hypothetical protein
MRSSALLLGLLAATAAAQAQTSLRGTVTDPSGAAVPGAVVQVRGLRGERRARTGDTGQYVFPSLAAGRYRIRILAKGFAAAEKTDLAIDRPTVFDAQLAIQTKTEEVNVEDAPGRVSAEPESNGGAVVMRGRHLAALSDDPDELALQLQALAGPAPGPNGGQIFIDGFTGGNLPPKSAIREVRINANPFSPEYDRHGFARVEIFTKPGSESWRGQALAQYNDERLNSRNPLLAGDTRPPYRAQLYGLDLSGPLRKNRAAFTLDAEQREIDENAFILATTLDAALNPVLINQALATPQSRTMISPRLDYALSPRNTLVVRYQELRIGLDNQGVGDFNLASRAYRQTQAEHTVQITETAAIGPRAINETRFQYMRLSNRDTAGSTQPSITVDGAFSEGGASTGNSASTSGNWELSNLSSYTKGSHTLKWGGRVRESRLDDTAPGNFAGTFTFYTLTQYEQTLALQQAGYTGAEMAQLGAGPSQFSLNAGTPSARVRQADAGLFAGDDCRARPNVTVSAGVRYEVQTNLGDRGDWAPRLGIAWGLDARANRPAKTVLRAGFGTFYDRIPLTATLNALRYNGITQQSYLILNPTFFPAIPPPAVLEADLSPQQLQPVSRRNVAPRLYQSSVGIDRQLNGSSRIAVTWTGSRGTHLLDARNVNAPIGEAYPFGDPSIRLLTESAGFSRQNQLTASTNATWRKLMLFGFYSLSYGKDDNEGLPADPYNLRAEWGPSVYGDVRQRLALGASVPVAWKLTVTSFLVANSGMPYNITTGLDPGDTGSPAERPALLAGVGAAACQGNGLVYTAAYGCFNSNPAPGSATIGRGVITHNFGRGPAAVNLALRISRTWAFGREGRTGLADSGTADHGGGAMPPRAMFTTNTGRKYGVTLSASTLNAPNHANYAPPNGDLSSPYFGQYRSLGGLMVMAHGGAPSTYNRKIDLQVRFTF